MLRRTTSMPCIRNIHTGRPLQVLKNLNEAPKEFSCGIPPWKVEHRPPKPPPSTPINQLIRPPCIPGSKPGPYQACMEGMKGFYCPPCRLKFKYPPFSENIDFLPSSIIPTCWWKYPISCGEDVEALETLKSKTTRWECAYD